jgi:tripartite-type tricarboxylate transporter receptor subunit TctC
MKKSVKRILALMTAAVMAVGMIGCSVGGGSSSGESAAPAENAGTEAAAGSGTSSLKGQNVRVVIGSTSTSGDSYMIADLVTRYLSAEMGFNGKVDAIGNAAALEEMQNQKGDGTTVMMFHDMTFLSVLFGAAAEDNWNSLADVTNYIKETGSDVSFNIESGATSHLAFAAYYLWVKETEGEEVSSHIKAIVGGTTAEKLQRLWDRNADVIYGDTSAFQQYTEEGVDNQLKMTMFGTCGEVEGLDVTSMAAEGVTFAGEPFEFAKDFCMYFPKDMDAGILAEYEAAMKKVTENPDFQKDMAALYYNTLSADEVGVEASKEYIYAKRETCKALIEQAPSLDDIAF